MPVHWYYQNEGGSVGPISVAELSYLINRGTINGRTLVRRGENGEWLALDKTADLPGTAGELGNADGSAPEIAEWFFNLKGQRKQGPVAWSVLKAMIVGGELQTDDLVWKPGMALWVPASQARGLVEKSSAITDGQPRFQDRPGSRVRPAVAAMIAMVILTAGVVGWKWVHTGLSDLADGGPKRAPGANEMTGAKGRRGDRAVEQVLEDARSAVRVEQLERAARLLEQYLASPLAVQADAAKVLLREIKLAGSIREAARLAQNLPDEALRDYLQNGADTLVAAIETPELRPIYQRTLLQAFRQENNRRQMIPRGAIAQNPNPIEAAPVAKDDEPDRPGDVERQGPEGQPGPGILGPAGPAEREPGENPDPKDNHVRRPLRPGLIAADLDYVLAEPGEFAGNALILNGLFKIGTKISEVKGPDGQVLGWSLPVARNDDSTVCSPEGKVSRHDAYLLLDDRLATFLDHVFNKLRLRPTIKPLYKCILTVTVRRLLVDGKPRPVVVISSMEVLGGCNYVRVARHEYSQAFRTLTVTADEADVDFGDGDLWVERLGGEENFVKPIRRKFRDMQRRAITDRDMAVIDRLLQRELVNVVNTASAINQIVAMEGLRRMRILP